MSRASSFDDALDAVEHLSAEDQETLLEVVKRRLAERRRNRLAAEIAEAQQEFANGSCTPAEPDQLLNEIAS